MCRSELFKGNMLNNRSALFEIIYYVEWDQVTPFLQRIMSKFSRNDFNQIEQRLYSSAISKCNKLWIDSGFILRVLLQIYRIEKKLKYDHYVASIKKKIAMERSSESVVLSDFESFREILEAFFPYTNDIDTLSIFSHCYSLGAGAVTFDLLYTYIQDSGFLILDFQHSFPCDIYCDTASKPKVSAPVYLGLPPLVSPSLPSLITKNYGVSKDSAAPLADLDSREMAVNEKRDRATRVLQKWGRSKINIWYRLMDMVGRIVNN